MANENIPFPRTPYPFDQPHADNFAGLKFVSDWLELPEESEEYYPESNALSPEDWIACNGQEDSTWVVLTKYAEDLEPLQWNYPGRWQPLTRNPKVGVVTDDFFNLWQVFLWR